MSSIDNQGEPTIVYREDLDEKNVKWNSNLNYAVYHAFVQNLACQGWIHQDSRWLGIKDRRTLCPSECYSSSYEGSKSNE
jgi:hypothetical protein